MALFPRPNAAFVESLGAIERPQTWLERVLKKRIILHTKDDQSIEGVLMEQAADGVILRASKLLGAGGKETVMAGEVWVPARNVAFAQLDE